MSCPHGSPSEYLTGRMIEPLSLEQGMTAADMIDKVFAASGFNARRLADACRLYARMLQDDAVVCLTLAGAMTPIGMSGPIRTMIERGYVDWIVATGANLYHDLHRTFGFPMVQGSPDVDDEELHRNHIARIYDVYIRDDETLEATDLCIQAALQDVPTDRPVSTADLHHAIGRNVGGRAPHPEKSMLVAAAEHDVPVFTSAPGDSSIGMNLIVPYVFGERIQLDVVRDVLETTALVANAEKTGVIEVGGGSPKNYFLQTQPILWQILHDDRGGHDYFIQLTTDSPQWGGLSGATASEARSWGKLKGAQRNNVVVYSCASLSLPLLVQYLMDRVPPREPKRLMQRKDEWTTELQVSARKRTPLIKEWKTLQKELTDG